MNWSKTKWNEMKGQMKTKDGDPVEYPIIRYVNVDIFGRIQHSIKGDEFWVGLEAHEVSSK